MTAPLPTLPLSQTSDPLNLNSLSVNLPLTTTTVTNPQPSLVLPSHLVPPTLSHPILGVHISKYIKFQVTIDGANFPKWRQIITSVLTMYKALDHI